MTAVNILAILLSPLIAVLVTLYIQKSKEKRERQRNLLEVLIATRHTPLIDQTVRALNAIDFIFYNKRHVRQLWHEYFDMLNNEGLNNENGFNQRQKKNLEMLAEMAKVLGYQDSISHLDVSRVYYPVGLGKQAERQDELSNELLRILKGIDPLMLRRHPEAVATDSSLQGGAKV